MANLLPFLLLYEQNPRCHLGSTGWLAGRILTSAALVQYYKGGAPRMGVGLSSVRAICKKYNGELLEVTDTIWCASAVVECGGTKTPAG